MKLFYLVDEGCSLFSVLSQFVCVNLMMCDGIFILTGHFKILECEWDSVMLVDHLFQHRISPWPKTAEKRGFSTGVTDRPTDGPTDGRTDPLIEMRS